MKTVRLHLRKKLYDPETGKILQLGGVVLEGTSIEVGLIYECLRRFGPIDISSEAELEILRKCEADLKRARETANEFELIDPDQE